MKLKKKKTPTRDHFSKGILGIFGNPAPNSQGLTLWEFPLPVLFPLSERGGRFPLFLPGIHPLGMQGNARSDPKPGESQRIRGWKREGRNSGDFPSVWGILEKKGTGNVGMGGNFGNGGTGMD